MRRALAAAAVALTALVALAGPAAADPPQPTDYRSVIDAVEPASAPIDVEVVGGDAFLQLTVDRGHDVTVAGYQGEPYLRVRSDGTVERNRRSPATYVNEDREGGADLPAEADPEAEPAWEQVASGGSYAWHDHRIHWMNPDEPDGERGDVVQGWTVDLTVDGQPTTIEGRLLWVEPANPWPWLGLGLVAAAALVVAGRGRSGRVAGGTAAAATVAAAGLALVVGAGQLADAPAQGAASPLLVAVPAVALLAGLAGVAGASGVGGALWRRIAGSDRAEDARTPRTLGALATLAGVAALLGWSVLRLEVLWKPVLPTGLPDGLDRAGTTLALALAGSAAVLVVRSGGLLLTRPSRTPEAASRAPDAA